MSNITTQLSPEIVEQTFSREVEIDGVRPGRWYIKGTKVFQIISVSTVEEDEENKYMAIQLRVREESSEYTQKELRWHDFINYYIKDAERLQDGEHPDDYIKEALLVIGGKRKVSDYAGADDTQLNDETALMASSSKELLMRMQGELEEKRNKAELVRRFVVMEMDRRRAELQKISDELEGVVSGFKKQIAKIMRVIHTIELYLGIGEELFQITEGEKAPSGTPITFRQLVLFMDEEVGAWEAGGLDFTDIRKFDEWLCDGAHLQQVLPEQKGVVVFRPRRYRKDYGDDALYNATMNEANKRYTYLLIRNGENLYRVFSENLSIQDRLFPRKKELEEMMNELSKAEDIGGYSGQRKKESVEDEMYRYKRKAILMQGLIDRTEVFHPLPDEEVNIFNLDALGDKVHFVYDDEEALPSGRLPFWHWHQKINSKIKHGSRVVVCNSYNSYTNRERLFKFYASDYSVPPAPKKGVYEVVDYDERELFTHRIAADSEDDDDIQDFLKLYPTANIVESYANQGGNTTFVIRFYREDEPINRLTILHNPKDTVYGGWGSYKSDTRKKRLRFRIEPTDREILNYDQIDLDDIEFYLHSRADRKNYIDMMPVLHNLKKMRLEEMEQEKHFAKLVYQQNMSAGVGGRELEAVIWKAIDWWKYKNQIKRPIEKDDAKALRMISNQLPKMYEKENN